MRIVNKITLCDAMVIFFALFTLCSHFLTMTAVSWHVQDSGSTIKETAEVIEQNQFKKIAFQLKQTGEILYLLIWAGIMSVWFSYIRKIQFGKHKELARFAIMIIFFVTLHTFVNDLAIVIGLMG